MNNFELAQLYLMHKGFEKQEAQMVIAENIGEIITEYFNYCGKKGKCPRMNKDVRRKLNRWGVRKAVAEYGNLLEYADFVRERQGFSGLGQITDEEYERMKKEIERM